MTTSIRKSNKRQVHIVMSSVLEILQYVKKSKNGVEYCGESRQKIEVLVLYGGVTDLGLPAKEARILLQRDVAGRYSGMLQVATFG